MGPALRDLQLLYDGKLDILRGDMDTFYNLKIQEHRTGAARQGGNTVQSKEETIRLKTITNDLRGKLSELEARVCVPLYHHH